MASGRGQAFKERPLRLGGRAVPQGQLRRQAHPGRFHPGQGPRRRVPAAQDPRRAVLARRLLAARRQAVEGHCVQQHRHRVRARRLRGRGVQLPAQTAGSLVGGAGGRPRCGRGVGLAVGGSVRRGRSAAVSRGSLCRGSPRVVSAERLQRAGAPGHVCRGGPPRAARCGADGGCVRRSASREAARGRAPDRQSNLRRAGRRGGVGAREPKQGPARRGQAG
mmetsp:Transcript_9141/g.35758  ORF Transcript_9141/g.35758 Transcript_9141/m.35758 type:complete len:221 (-) Transcript_9141:1596-2258(-)